jgi:hypothetical protein
VHLPRIEDRDDLPEGVTAASSADGRVIIVRGSLAGPARKAAIRRLLAVARQISGLARIAVAGRPKGPRP